MSFEMLKLLLGGIVVTVSLLVLAQWVSTWRYNRKLKKTELKNNYENLRVRHLVLYQDKIRDRR